MAQIELRLSNKVQKDTGRSEVMLRFFYTKHDFYAKTEVFVNPEFFEYYVDRKKTINPKKPIPDNKNTTTLDKEPEIPIFLPQKFQPSKSPRVCGGFLVLLRLASLTFGDNEN